MLNSTAGENVKSFLEYFFIEKGETRTKWSIYRQTKFSPLTEKIRLRAKKRSYLLVNPMDRREIGFQCKFNYPRERKLYSFCFLSNLQDLKIVTKIETNIELQTNVATTR